MIAKTKISVFLLISFIFVPVMSFAQHTHSGYSDNKQKTGKTVEQPAGGEELPSGLSGMTPDQYKDMKRDSTKSEHRDMKMKQDSVSSEKDTSMIKDTSLVRKGVIDLLAIDKNKDGKVYQDQMHLNVISDESGKCPLCGMKLKEVSLDKAKENLVKLGFKVKEK